MLSLHIFPCCCPGQSVHCQSLLFTDAPQLLQDARRMTMVEMDLRFTSGNTPKVSFAPPIIRLALFGSIAHNRVLPIPGESAFKDTAVPVYVCMQNSSIFCTFAQQLSYMHTQTRKRMHSCFQCRCSESSCHACWYSLLRWSGYQWTMSILSYQMKELLSTLAPSNGIFLHVLLMHKQKSLCYS